MSHILITKMKQKDYACPRAFVFFYECPRVFVFFIIRGFNEADEEALLVRASEKFSAV